MDIKILVQKLHPLERKVIPFIAKAHSLKELQKYSKLQKIEVVRALQWLANKNLIDLSSKVDKVASIDKLGLEYVKIGLPERRLLKLIKDSPLSLRELQESMPKQEVGVSLGILKSKAAIVVKDNKVCMNEQGEKLLSSELLEEKLLSKLKSQPVAVSSLSHEEKFALENLKKRKSLVQVRPVKITFFKLTDIGAKVSQQKLDADVIDRVTPDHLKLGAWKDKDFRHYDVKVNVPRISFGRKHHYKAFLDSVRTKFTTLGFKEMTGPIVESDFWDMDALFMPQFHSARDIHEAYYIKDPEYTADLDPKIVASVKKVHEDGGDTGSKGWRYNFDLKRTSRLLLRTQGTACSARKLASKDLKIPGKYFGITKCFRYDVVDATHLPDFFQTEGIVLEDGLNLSHLKGLLKLFGEEIGECDQIKIRPAYFPFTEPSCELFAKHPEMGWIELGGAGIFRPEMTNALGIDVPVIAWGLGIDRIGMFKLGIDDIRDLLSHNLEFLKYVKVL